MRSFAEISMDMAAVADRGSGDPENAHAAADDLLIETIELLVYSNPHPEQRDTCARIIQSWKETPKWYA